ncbi:hypothetical protein LSH36_358g01013 [Paralvinella palmiformis]|uniref:Counting factor associated protein D n=1 Tax=Paralvinella palmiformis TaxID=53620 RepID=A0AAD9MZI5_9ANNE|nr:hypothetical protein LSH36_358g01013 [Paralvinella palmiformis]
MRRPLVSSGGLAVKQSALGANGRRFEPPVGLGATTFAAAVPKWESLYNITGILYLPYAEVKEPFTAWYDGSKNRSRVDYYDSSVITIQLGQNKTDVKGIGYKIVPVFMNGTNARKCFLINGTKSDPITLQSVLPDLTGFVLIGKKNRSGQICDVWQKTEMVGAKKNSYTIWISQKNEPVRYEMLGYDTLMGSHYDRYYLDYGKMTVFKVLPDDIFKPQKGLTCGAFPGPGDAEHRILMNPMKEYIDHDESQIDAKFEKFKKKHDKKYKNQVEHERRKHYFRQNVRFIHSKNRAGLSYKLRVNHLADMTEKELAVMRGYRPSLRKDSGAIPFDKMAISITKVPAYVDWRLYGAVTPVKDQAVCGSCWSFGTTGTVEGAYFLKTGQLVSLSEQELMDCTWDEGNNACDGGEDFRAYQWIMKNGLSTEDDYGPYLSQDGYCHFKNVTSKVHVESYITVTANSSQALKLALTNYGPISVSIDASHKSLRFYANGIYFEPKCGNKPDQLDHAVLAVGFGVLNGQSYWLIKNSWSTYWGNDGYMLISQADNNCGVATSPTFVVI